MPAQLGWREAAIEVLGNKPDGLLYTDIANEIISRGLRTSLGATPAASVNAAITDSISKDAKSPFERTARGVYRLRSEAAISSSISVPQTPAGTSPETEELERKKETTGLINAFGMYWSRENIHWSPTIPRLLGRQTVGSTPVDFTDQRGVYLLYDRGAAIYVGRAIDQGVGTRLKQHTIDRLGSRWDRFSWFGVHRVSEDGSLNKDEQTYDRGLLIATMEALLIESVEPTQNRRRGDDFSAVEFLQADDPEVEKIKKKALLAEMQSKLL